MSQPLEQMARLIAGLDERVGGLEGERRFANASLENAGINEYDLNGNLVSRTGAQQDGSHGSFSLGGRPPPRPSAPTYRVETEKLVVAWDGTFAASVYEHAPLDWTRCEVHVGEANADPLAFASLRTPSFEGARGGELTLLGLPTDTDLYVWLVGRTQSGKFSTPSVRMGPFQLHTPADAAAAMAKAEEARTLAQDAATKADEAEAAALAAAGLAGDASTAAGEATQAAEDASTAAGVASGQAADALTAANKPRIVYTTSAPVGDTTVLWVPPPNNVPHKWNTTTSAWVPIPDAAVKAASDAAVAADAKAADAATAAQNAANAASTAQGKADAAMTTATGKNTVTYSANAASSSVPGIRSGDVWFQQILTVGDPRFGQIKGSWSWTGTAWASAVFGDEVLGTLTAGKITAGTISSHIQIASRISTSALTTGARREVNAVGFQAWDASNNLTISLDGINNLLTGKYRSALSGRRIEMASSGSLSQIDLWGDGTNRTFIRSFTEADGKEAIQIGYGDPTQNGMDNRLNINSAGWFTSRFARTDFVVGANWNLFGAAYDAGQHWMGYTASTKALVWNNISSQQTFQTGTYYHEANDGFTWWVRPVVGQADVSLGFNKQGRLGVNYGLDSYYGGMWQFVEATQAYTTSPKLTLTTSQGYGGYMRFNGGDGWAEMEFKKWDDSAFINARANLFINNSDEASKTDVVDTEIDYIALNNSARTKRYKRIWVDENGKTHTGPWEIGLIAQQAPAQIVNRSRVDGSLGIDLYQMCTVNWGTNQQLNTKIESVLAYARGLEARLATLEGATK